MPHTDDRERSLGHLKQLILVQLNDINFICIASLQEVISHFLPNCSNQNGDNLQALLLQWLFYFNHLPNFGVSDSLPEPSQFLAVTLLLGECSHSLRILRTVHVPQEPDVWTCMGVGVRAFKGPTASFLLSFQSLSTRPLMPVDSFILHDPLSPLELVHVLPAFPFPPPGALTLRQRNAFLKRWVISHPFANCLSYP